MSKKEQKRIADMRRLAVLETDYAAKAGHIGGAMSCLEILTCLYYEIMDVEKIRARDDDRDRFIMSKGHSAEALYCVLCDREFFLQRRASDICPVRNETGGAPHKKGSRYRDCDRRARTRFFGRRGYGHRIEGAKQGSYIHPYGRRGTIGRICVGSSDGGFQVQTGQSDSHC